MIHQHRTRNSTINSEEKRQRVQEPEQQQWTMTGSGLGRDVDQDTWGFQGPVSKLNDNTF